MKDIIFWATDAWKAMKLMCLRKEWCPILNITHKENPIQYVSSEDETHHWKNSFKKYQDNANVKDVDEWLIADDPEFNINDDEFVQSMLHDFNNTSSLEETE